MNRDRLKLLALLPLALVLVLRGHWDALAALVVCVGYLWWELRK